MTASTSRIQYFLLIYDRRRDELMSHEPFGAAARLLDSLQSLPG